MLQKYLPLCIDTLLCFKLKFSAMFYFYLFNLPISLQGTSFLNKTTQNLSNNHTTFINFFYNINLTKNHNGKKIAIKGFS
ncbi:hypothetical protein TcarDRAFT_2741 [Thermosinus carboxydivorans Nor1]|uniref:Uncharacterized protein n=1 Tax=Thermosinus carboxydivorans Nor1 TaxID=401526 RepID=A1HMI7_9FIRM|nr:hypothetical protein TcarDRAFT_2741 [Thermosinus carboxydivorans Nor1]